jgi:hypothetical protein
MAMYEYLHSVQIKKHTIFFSKGVHLRMPNGTKAQFNGLFLVMDEKRRVANFALTKSTSLDEVKIILQRLGDIEAVYTGNNISMKFLVSLKSHCKKEGAAYQRRQASP